METKIKKGEAPNQRIQELLINNFKWMIAAAVLIIFVLGYFLFLQPRYDDIVNQKNDLASEKTELSSLENELLQLNSSKESYKSLDSATIDKINSILPDSKNKDDLPALFENIALKNGLLLTSINVNPQIAGEAGGNAEETINSIQSGNGEIGKIRISLQVFGTDYANLKKFLIALENNLRLLDVNKIDFSPATKKTTIDLVTYYLQK